jgi:quinol monooxygenase YgiN
MAFALTVLWEGRPEVADELEALLREHQDNCRAEPGCRAYFVHRTATPGTFLLYEQFDDRAAFEAHRESEHFKRVITNRGLALLARERTITFLETL